MGVSHYLATSDHPLTHLFDFSFQDVLNNEKLKLDWMFQMSFASDVARVRTCKYFVLEFIMSKKKLG